MTCPFTTIVSPGRKGSPASSKLTSNVGSWNSSTVNELRPIRRVPESTCMKNVPFLFISSRTNSPANEPKSFKTCSDLSISFPEASISLAVRRRPPWAAERLPSPATSYTTALNFTVSPGLKAERSSISLAKDDFTSGPLSPYRALPETYISLVRLKVPRVPGAVHTR